MIDLDTPEDAYEITSYTDGTQWQLVFSDEFNTDGRTFYPGDDPYWEAADMHYWVSQSEEEDRLELVDRYGRRLIILSGMTLPQLRRRMVLWSLLSKRRRLMV